MILISCKKILRLSFILLIILFIPTITESKEYSVPSLIDKHESGDKDNNLKSKDDTSNEITVEGLTFNGYIPEYVSQDYSNEKLYWPDNRFKQNIKSGNLIKSIFSAVLPRQTAIITGLGKGLRLLTDKNIGLTTDRSKTDYIKKLLNGKVNSITALEAYDFGNFALSKKLAITELNHIQHQYGTQPSTSLAKAYIQAAVVHEETNDPRDTEISYQYWLRASEIYKSMKMRREEAAVLINFTEFLLRYRRFNEAQKIHSFILSLGKLPEDLEMRLLRISARMLAERGRCVEAIRSYSIAFQYWENKRTSKQEKTAKTNSILFSYFTGIDESAIIPEFEAAKVLSDLSELMVSLGHYEEAESLLNAAIDKTDGTDIHFSIRRLRFFIDLADILINNHKYNDAKKIIGSIYNITEWKSLLLSRSVAEYELLNSALLLNKNDIADAEHSIRFALYSYQYDLGNSPDALKPLNLLSVLYRRQGLYDDASWYASVAYSFAKQTHLELGDYGEGSVQGSILRETYLNFIDIMFSSLIQDKNTDYIGAVFNAAQYIIGLKNNNILSQSINNLAYRDTIINDLLSRRSKLMTLQNTYRRELLGNTIANTSLNENIIQESKVRASKSTDTRSQYIWSSQVFLNPPRPISRTESSYYLFLNQELANVTNKLFEADPSLANLLNNQPVSISQVRGALHDDEVFIQFVSSSNSTYVIAFDKTSVSINKINIKSTELQDNINLIRNNLKLNDSGELKAFDESKAINLYNLLFKPVSNVLINKKRLLISKDGPLNSLPFSVLKIDPNYWLIDKYSILNIPSARMLTFLRKEANVSHGKKSFLGIGDPLLSDGATTTSTDLFEFGLNSELPSIHDLPLLPDTKNELTTIARFYGKTASNLLIGKDATEDNIRNLNLADYKIISFATHAVTPNEIIETDESALVLTPPTKSVDENDDGLLTTSEISNLKLDADLVILSACNTASGNDALTNDGFSGLAQSFIASGARAVMVSHWPVASGPTVELMTEVARELQDNKQNNASLALVNAMRKMKANLPVEINHPMIWAPFTLYGVN